MGSISRHDLERVASSIESLHNSMFDREGVKAYPYGEACAMAGDEPNWEELTKGQQRAVMERYVDWQNFTPSDVEHTIKNVLTGKPKEAFFERVEINGDYNKKDYSKWVADEKNPIRAAVRRLNFMKASQDPDWPGNPLRSNERVKWDDLSDEQKTDRIVYEADRGHRLFSEEYGDMRERIIDRALGREDVSRELAGQREEPTMPTKDRDALKLDPLNRPIVGQEFRELAAEIKSDEQAARVRDGVEAAPEPCGTYQVWQRNGEEFRHVANVEAGNYLAAVMLPIFKKGTPGTERVSWLVDDARPTGYGDRIVDPLGKAYELYQPDFGGAALRETTLPGSRDAPPDYQTMLDDAARLAHKRDPDRGIDR
jgi:hypothetical protein